MIPQIPEFLAKYCDKNKENKKRNKIDNRPTEEKFRFLYNYDKEIINEKLRNNK